jgi:hypothetical protein
MKASPQFPFLMIAIVGLCWGIGIGQILRGWAAIRSSRQPKSNPFRSET